MSPVQVLVLCIYLLSAILTLAIALVSRERRVVAGARPFGLYAFAASAWLLALTFRLIVPGLEAKIFLTALSWIPTLATPVFLLMLARDFTAGHNHGLGQREAALLMPSLAFPALLLADAKLGILRIPYRMVETSSFAAIDYPMWPVFAVPATYAYCVTLVALGRILLATLRARGGRRAQAALLLAGAVLPALASFLAFTGVTIAGLRDGTPYGFLLGDLAMVFALTRIGAFQPAAPVRAIALEMMRDMLVITDGDGVIRDYNPAARNLPGTGRRGMRLDAVIPSVSSVPPEAWKDAGSFVEITDESEGRRWLEVSRSTIEGFPLHGEDWHAYLFRDITKRKLIELELVETGRRLLEQTTELQRAQAELIRSEKMAALGRLMAGIAHEMNSPLGAMSSAVDSCAELLPTVIRDTGDLAGATVGDGRKVDLAFLERAAACGKEPAVVTSADERAAERKAVDTLVGLGVNPDEARKAAARVAGSGIAGCLDLAAPHIVAGRGEEAIRAGSSIATMASFLAAMKLSVAKLAKVVKSLRAAGKGVEDGKDTEKPRHIDLAGSVEEALDFFAPAFRRGVILRKELPGGIVVNGRPEELGMIWQALAQNGIEAMEGKGRLSVLLDTRGGEAVFRVIDEGHGIDSSVRDRVFEPFVTTKRVGEGAGLGLDIARRAVANHGGTISFESRPGCTCFEVRLPLASPPFKAKGA